MSFTAKILVFAISFLALAVFHSPAPQVKAFDFFSNCITQSDGTKVCGPCKENPNAPTCKQAKNQGTKNPVISTIRTASNILAVVAGVAAVVMIMISGFRFITAGGVTPGQRGGDPNNVKTARATLLYSVVGLVVIALAWTIVRFITDRVLK
jgi:hypothetical protein